MDKKTFFINITKLKSICSQHVNDNSRELGVSNSESLYLKCLSMFGSQTQSKLSEMIGFDKARSSRVLAELESKELVQRVLSENDNRKTFFEITPRGEEIQTRVEDSLDYFVDNILFENIDVDEKQNFFETLNKMVSNIDKYNKGDKDEKTI